MREIRLIVRSLTAAPGFSLVVIATLALGIGVNTATFSVLSAVLLAPLPYQEPDRVVTVWESNPEVGVDLDRVSGGTFFDWQERSRGFEALSAYQHTTFLVGGVEPPEQVTAVEVTPDIFDVVGVDPVVGRAFTESEGTDGGVRVAILAYDFSERRFASAETAVGSTIVLDEQPHTIVGVMPPRFEFPPDDERVALWVPLVIDAQVAAVRAMRVYNVVGRLDDRTSLEEARGEITTIAAEIAAENPESNRGWSARIVPALEQVVGDHRRLLLMLAGAGGFVLLIGCANVVNLLLARSTSKVRELGIRAALGASRPRVAARGLVESMVLALSGGVAGVFVAVAGVRLMSRWIPPDIPRADEIAVDGAVLAFATLVSVLAGLFLGSAPALHALRTRLTDVLQEGSGGNVGGRRFRGVLNAVVGGQVAAAFILLGGAVVMLRSVSRLLDVDPGFDVEGVATVALSLPTAGYEDRASQIEFYHTLVDRVASLPGVEAAGAVTALPMSPAGNDFDLPLQVEGRDPRPIAERPRAEYRAVVTGYFEAMGIPLVRGRLIDRFDREEGNPVMVINETAERLLFPTEDAIGEFMGVPMAGRIEVVGVVGDVRHYGLGSDVRPEIFVSYQNFPLREMHVVVRGTDEAAALIPAVREQIRRLDPRLPVAQSATLRELVSATLAQPRFTLTLLLTFAGCALLLAAVGIYGVVAYSVAQRTGEIGIRMVLGADGPRAMLLVVRQSLSASIVGAGVGLLGAVGIGRAFESLVFGVDPVDPVTLIFVGGLLLVVVAAAAVIPARFATRVDPAKTIKRG